MFSKLVGACGMVNSAAVFGFSHTASPPPNALRRLATNSGSKWIAGLVINVTTNMALSLWGYGESPLTL